MANSTYAQSALSLVTDFTYAGLPILIVRNLQMSRYKRISLSLMLGLGAVASIAVIVRIPYVTHLATGGDFLWDTTDVAIWSCVEPGLGLTILNLVVTRPLFRSLFARFGAITSNVSFVAQQLDPIWLLLFNLLGKLQSAFLGTDIAY